MSANFTPNQNEYKNLTPFKTWLLLQINTWGMTNFPYVESDFDELTNYGMMQQLMGALNDVIDNENEVEQDMTNLFNAFTELQSYVNDYFDNLDVQDEINAKLDEMAQDGSLTQLIKQYVDPIYEEFESEINTKVSNIENMVTASVSGMPIPVSSTSAMTDTTKLYLNTTDGYWYYYNGSEWTQGGIYQATEIGDGQIDLLNLDELIQENFNTEYSQLLDLGTYTTGFCSVNSSGNLVINTSNTFGYYIYNLEPNVTYQYNGTDVQSANGLIITDENNNVLYHTNNGYDDNDYHGVNNIFRIKKPNCKAYITFNISGTSLYQPLHPMLRKLIDISNNLKVNTNTSLIQTLNDTYSTTNTGLVRLTNDSTPNRFKLHVYSYEKGKKYHIKSYNMYQAKGIMITDENGVVSYVSSSSSTNTPTFTEYEFVAQNNGFIFINQYQNYAYSIDVLFDAIEINLDNKFKGLKIGADGDSISAGVSGNLSYITQIANSNNCTLQNLSVGGGTIATNTYSGETARHWICTSVNNLASDCDIIMLSGGVNDYWNKVPMGEITTDYTSTLDTTTFYGALETMCRNVLDKFKTQKIVFVTYHKIGNIYYTYNSSVGERHTFKEYLDAIYKVMNKYSIPVIDINSKGRFNTALDYYKNNYTNNSDGVHPTTTGYEKFYNDLVVNGLNDLMQ